MMKALSGRNFKSSSLPASRDSPSKQTMTTNKATNSSTTRTSSGRWSLRKGFSSSKGLGKHPAAPNDGGLIESPKKLNSATQVAQRLTSAVANHPIKTGRSQAIVPLTRDFDRLRKNLRDLIKIANKHRQALMDLGAARIEV